MTKAIDTADRTAHTGQKVLLVTGPSGAGRTTAVHALEDVGFEVINNLPLGLIPRLLSGPAPDHPLALGIDVRTRDFSALALADLIDQMTADPNIMVELLFLDCRPDILVRRYSETRRRHPLATEDSPEQGIEREIALLAPIRDRADVLIDTSDLTVHELKAGLMEWLGLEGEDRLSISVQSFSYKRGVPRGLDLVFDVRFLQNPHWQPDLRPLTGCDAAVAAFVAADPRHDEFVERVSGLVEFLLPAYASEGKSHLAIGFGCTGGRHRSVALAETLARGLADAGWQVSIRHRELGTAKALPVTSTSGGRTA